jgi:fluoride exporter
MRLVAVMMGGAAGALARWTIELGVPSVGGFPLATLLINVTGAFALGVLLWERLAPTRYLRPLLGIGFLGAYTTFSTLHLGDPAAAGGWRLALRRVEPGAVGAAELRGRPGGIPRRPLGRVASW